MCDAPNPSVKRFDLVFVHSIKNMTNNLACKIFGVVTIGQSFIAEAKDRFNIWGDLILVQVFLLLSLALQS